MKHLAFTVAALGWTAAMTGLAVSGPIGVHPLASGVFYTAGFIGMIAMVRRFPDSLNGGRGLLFVFALGVAGRILFLSYPVGNDIYRYVWEGLIQNHGFNPYVHSPDSELLVGVRQSAGDSIWQQINHKNLPAIYPPFVLLLFRFLAAVAPDPLFFKIIIVLLDVSLLAVLAALLTVRREPIAALLFYAANPLVLLYVAGEGHYDGLQALLLIIGIYLLVNRRTAPGFVVLGLAGMSKFFAFLALPFLISAGNWKKAPLALLPLLFYLPFADAGRQLFHSLEVFGLRMHYNDAAAAVLRWLLPEIAVIPTLAVLLAVCLVSVFLFVQEKLRSVFAALACLLLLLPTLHPWYLVLVAPFLVFHSSAAWLFLQAAMVFTFPVLYVELTSGVFQEMPWLKLLCFGPFYALLLHGIFHNSRVYWPRRFPRPESLSVVMPVLNEAAVIGRCLHAVKKCSVLREVILVDGGSTDRTVAIARQAGVKIVTSRKGRGMQVEAGLRRASGDLVLVLHADCVLAEGVLAKMLSSLQRAPEAVGGSVAMSFAQGGFACRVVSLLNRLRTRLTGISFGDQAQFFRRPVLDANNNLADMMLMEDVELSLLLKEQGRLVLLKEGVRVSGRRWQTDGFVHKLFLVMHLFLRYLIERRWRGGGQTRYDYYGAYYGNPGD